jgi:hypothetical protein
MKMPNLIQKARDLWNRKEDQRRAAAHKEADQHREEEARQEQQRKDEPALEQFEKHALGYNADLDGEWEEDLPVDMPAVPVTTLQEATPATTAAELPQYGMEPLIPLTEAEVEKLNVIEAEDPQGRSMHAQFDPRTVIALREQAEAEQEPAPGQEPDDDMDMDR